MIQDLPLKETEPKKEEDKYVLTEEDLKEMVFHLDEPVIKKGRGNPSEACKLRGYYIHMILESNLKQLHKEVTKHDWDGFIVIDGQEGTGKTTLALQIAKYLDPTFNIDRCVFTITQFLNATENADKGQAIVFDETMGYLGSRGSMSKFNRILLKVFSEMRSKNLFIILCIPSFFELDKYPAIHRSVCLFHVNKRSKFVGYNFNKKKLLYIAGKKYYSYSWPSADFIGHFVSYFVLDKIEYNKKKTESIKQFNDSRDREKSIENQRDILIRYLRNELNLKNDEIALKTGLSPNRVSEISTLKPHYNNTNLNPPISSVDTQIQGVKALKGTKVPQEIVTEEDSEEDDDDEPPAPEIIN